MAKVEAIEYGDRRVFTVSAFNRGVGSWLQRLPTVWVEGEISELRRQERWQSVFFTLKDAGDGSILAALMPRGQFDGLRLDLRDGERVHVYGRPELFEPRGELRLRALSIERFGLGEHLAALERLKQKLAAEGLFAPERKRPLPRIPRRIGLVTGNDAAAKRDVIAAVQGRFPPARILVAETSCRALARRPPSPRRSRSLRRAGGRRRRARARGRQLRGSLAVQRRARRPRRRRLSGVGRQRGRPRAGHAALRSRRGRPRLDADRGRAARRPRPRRAARVARPRAGPGRPGRPPVGRAAPRADRLGGARGSAARRAPRRAPARRGSITRPRRLRALSPLATLERGYAIVRRQGAVVREASTLASGDEIDVRVADGGFTGTVERCAREVRGSGEGAGADRRAARERQRLARRRGSALGAGRGAVQALPRAAGHGPGQGRGARAAVELQPAGARLVRIPRMALPRSPEEGRPLREPGRQGGREDRAARSSERNYHRR